MSTNLGRIDKYELQELLGRDGMAEVWKAFDTQARRYVAIKFLHANPQADPDFVARFQRETPTIAALRHPNIVQYYDFSVSQPPGTGNITAYMVMNYVDGGTLADYIRNTSRQGKFPPAADIVRLFTLIGNAVEYAHQHGMVHGQLKPTNILLDKRITSHNAMGEPVVTDFGILKLLGVAVGATGRTPTSGGDMISDMDTISSRDAINRVPAGTSLYTSPEQIKGSPGDERSDIYSLGIMLYEICAGTPPFPGNDPATIMMQHVNTIPTLPALINPGLPAALTTIIMRAIAKDPRARFPTAASLVEALAQVVGPEAKEASTLSMPVNVSQPDYSVKAMDLPTILTSTGQPSQTAKMIPTPSPSRKPARKTLWIVLAALLILALVGSVLGAYLVFFTKSPSSTASMPLMVGHAYFVSSGLLGPDTGSVEGINDELQIKLENISPPPAGKAYYAWLLNAKGKDWSPIPLGQLPVKNGTGVLSYPGDPLHTDLLANNSRFFITEEAADPAPVSPSPDRGALLYYAEFSQVGDPNNPKHYSLYDHLQHLLANDPKIDAVQLHGGLDTWLYRNTQSVLEWANSARDANFSGSGPFIHSQLIRIIDYLDGTYYNQIDLPGIDPLGVLNDFQKTVAKIGLLTFYPTLQVNNPGYIYHISTHLRDITALPQANTEQKAIADQIDQALNAVNSLFQTLRMEVLKLYNMPLAQLVGSDARTMLNEVATLANDAFVGQINSQGQVIEGVAQIHYEIQRLATFDIGACTASNPCPPLA